MTRFENEFTRFKGYADKLAEAARKAVKARGATHAIVELEDALKAYLDHVPSATTEELPENSQYGC